MNIAQFRGVAIVNQLGVSNVTPTLLWRNLFYRMQEKQELTIEALWHSMQRVSGILSRHSLMAPPAPWRVFAAVPAVAVLILPDGTAAGDLEELVWRAVQQAEPAVAGIEGYSPPVYPVAILTPRAPRRVHMRILPHARDLTTGWARPPELACCR